jgi:hypothetical protein
MFIYKSTTTVIKFIIYIRGVLTVGTHVQGTVRYNTKMFLLLNL